jgi:hypothetical protein
MYVIVCVYVCVCMCVCVCVGNPGQLATSFDPPGSLSVTCISCVCVCVCVCVCGYVPVTAQMVRYLDSKLWLPAYVQPLHIVGFDEEKRSVRASIKRGAVVAPCLRPATAQCWL